MKDPKDSYPEGHFIGILLGAGIAIFSGVGIALGIAIGNPAFFGVGPAIGAGVGAGIGSAVEARYRQQGKIRPLTEEEKRQQGLFTRLGIGLLIIGVVVFLALLITR